MFLGSASTAKPSAGAGFAPLPQAFALALPSSPLLQLGMVLELIFTATAVLAVWSLKKAFRRAKIPPNISTAQLPFCWEQRSAPDLFYIHAHHFPGASRASEVFLALLMLRSLPARISLSLSGPCSCPITGSVTLRTKYSLK